MHLEALQWVSSVINRCGPWKRVLEIGSKNLNGSVRPMFDCVDYIGVDISPGAGVDIVADGVSFYDDKRFDCVVCCEVFEHTPEWHLIIANAFENLREGGTFIVTAAAPNRPEHSAVDGGPLEDGEFYEGIAVGDLAAALDAAGFSHVVTELLGEDVRAYAVR